MEITKDNCAKIANRLKNINNKKHLSKDIQKHLDNCLKCLIVFSQDSNLQKRLKQVVKNEVVPKRLEVSVKNFVQTEREDLQKIV